MIRLCLFQASAAKEVRTALFWVITQRVVAILYRLFGTTYRSHRQGSKILIPEDGTDRMSRKVGKKLPLIAS